MFGKLFGTKKATAPERVTPLPGAVASSILSIVGARGIPPMQGAAQKAFQLSTDPNAEARDFIEVIESDEGLSARIIKIANSVFFDRGKKAHTIEESVLVIGIEELRSVLNATALSTLFPSTNALRAQLWANDIATGIIARALARKLSPENAEFAFLGGLMHDIGKLLLVQRAPDLYTKVISLIEKEGMPFPEAEAQIFVFDHTEVGQLIGEKWGFGSDLLEIIRTHHRTTTDGSTKAPSSRLLVQIIQCADTMAHALGIGHPRGFHRFRNRCEESLSSQFAEMGTPSSSLNELRADLLKTYESEYLLYTKGD